MPPVATTSTTNDLLPLSLQSLALPAKLIKRIQELEYIDMGELVPESWRHQDDETRCCHRRPQRKGPVTDILLWVECFSSMVTVLSAKYPEKAPDFMSYLKVIVKASRTFKGDGWVTYDSCYRRNAALMKSLEWGRVDFNLYNETFTGQARPIRRCSYCNSEHHVESDCTLAPDTRPYRDNKDRYRDRYPSTRPSAPLIHLCHLYNAKYGNKCPYNPCKFTHVCLECKGKHPLSSCNRGKLPPTRRLRDTSPRGTKN